MGKNEEITQLSDEIMQDLTSGVIPLHSALLKAARLSLLVDIPKNVQLFKDWAKYAEENSFVISSFNTSMEAAKDPNISVSSANEYERVTAGISSNIFERTGLRTQAQKVANNSAFYRAEAYNFALNIYTTWKFGNIAQNIFEKKREKSERVLSKIFPDINQRMNSIAQNLNSGNQEDWKNAVFSCRTLLMDIADILHPPTSADDTKKYITRLQTFVSPKATRETRKKLINTYLEELKDRIEITMDLTQGSSHKDRPIVEDAQNIVLYTYLIISDLMEIYDEREKKKSKVEEHS